MSNIVLNVYSTGVEANLPKTSKQLMEILVKDKNILNSARKVQKKLKGKVELVDGENSYSVLGIAFNTINNKSEH